MSRNTKLASTLTKSLVFALATIMATLALAGVETNTPEVLADAISQQVKSGLSAQQAPYLGAR